MRKHAPGVRGGAVTLKYRVDGEVRISVQDGADPKEPGAVNGGFGAHRPAGAPRPFGGELMVESTRGRGFRVEDRVLTGNSKE